MRGLVLVVVGLLAIVGGPFVVVAAAPATPAAATCHVAPRSQAEIEALLSPPPADSSSFVPMPDVPTGGHPADAATVAGITATVQELVACLNAGAFFSALALYTDDYIHYSITTADLTPAEFEDLATPTPLAPDDRLTLVAVQDVRVQSDGRVVAMVVTTGIAPDAGGASVKIFVHTGGRWLIDEDIPVVKDGTPVAAGATPSS